MPTLIKKHLTNFVIIGIKQEYSHKHVNTYSLISRFSNIANPNYYP